MTATVGQEGRPLRREPERSMGSWPVFAFYALATLGYAAFIGLMFAQMASGLDVFLPGQFGQMQHGAVGSHRIHDITYGLMVTTLVMGVLAQIRRPLGNISGMVMTLIPFAGLMLAAALSADGFDIVVRRNPLYQVAALAGVTALLHPSGRRLFHSFRAARINWPMLVLIGVAAVPLIAFASSNIRLQGTAPDEHYFLGHYGFMAAFSFTVIGLGLLAALRADGWRLTAWVAGVLPAVVGVSSLLFPDATSSLEPLWALGGIGWGALFVAAAALSKNGPRLADQAGEHTGNVPAAEAPGTPI
jgi:hypothetical protein